MTLKNANHFWFFYSKVGAFLCQEKLKFSSHPTWDPLQLHFMSRIIKSSLKNQLWPNRELISKKSLHPPKIECDFHQFIHSKKRFVWVFFRQVLLSLPKLAVKNNSSKKNTQMWAKNTLMVDFLAQSRWAAAESGNFRCFRCAYIYTAGLDYSISHSTSQYPICVKNNSMKTYKWCFSSAR